MRCNAYLVGMQCNQLQAGIQLKAEMLEKNGGRPGSLPDSKILHPNPNLQMWETSKNCPATVEKFLGRAANRGKILAEWLSVISPAATSHFHLNLSPSHLCAQSVIKVGSRIRGLVEMCCL